MMKKILLLFAIALPLVLISCGDKEDEPGTPDNHVYVDLGQPSGTLWATCNVGANSPEEFGDYFAWGETAPKDCYDWKSYKWGDWEVDTISENYYQVDETWYKYYDKNWTDDGFVEGDGKTELDPEDDAAYVNWGSKWRTPTLEQFQELVEYCDWQWAKLKGVNGRLVTGPNGKSIFLPASGGYSEYNYHNGRFGYYWSRTRCSSDKLAIEAADQGHAYILFLDSGGEEVWYNTRYNGQSVRPVRVSKK